MAKKLLWLAVAVIYFLSAYFGYQDLAEKILLVIALVGLPVYIRTEQKRHEKGRQNGQDPVVDDRVQNELRILKTRFYVLAISSEVIFACLLTYKIFNINFFAILAGLDILWVIAFAYFYLLYALCPKCGFYFFQDDPSKPIVQVGPGSLEIPEYPFQVVLTSKCMNCGISFNAIRLNGSRNEIHHSE